MKRFILVQFLMLGLCVSSYAKNECRGLFLVLDNKTPTEVEFDTVIKELRELRLEMMSQDFQTASLAKTLFDSKYAELSKYFPNSKIRLRLAEVSNFSITKKKNGVTNKSIFSSDDRQKIFNLFYYLESKGLKSLSDSADGRKFRALNYIIKESREDLIDTIITLREKGHPKNDELFKDFDPNQNGDLKPLLTEAILQENKDLAKKLVQLGADINHINRNDKTSILYQISNDGTPEMIKFLLELGADVNLISNSMSPLMRASHVGKTDNVKALIDLNADLNQQNNDGLTAIFFALMGLRQDIIIQLYEAGADPNLKSNELKTALGMAYDFWAMSSTIFRDITITLIQITKDVNLPRPGGTTALTQYAKEGQVEIVKALLEKGVDPRAKDSNGNTAYELAKANNQTEVLELLKTYGVGN